MVGLDVTEEICEKFVDSMAVDSAPLVMDKLSKLIGNVVNDPKNDKYRLIPTSNKVISNVLKEDPKALEYLELVGFQRSASGSEYSLRPGSEDIQKLSVGLRVLQKNLNVSSKEESKQSTSSEFDAFKPKIDRLGFEPERTGTNYTLEQKVAQLSKQREDTLYKAGIPERELKVYETSVSTPVKLANLPDNYSKKVDVALLKELAASNAKKAAKAQNFQTKAQRELERLGRSQVYTKAQIRVKFPDGLTVSANFSPLERLSDVEAEVQNCMNQPGKYKFALYSPPSTKKLDSRMTLAELKVGSGQRFSAKWDGEAPEGEYIKDSLINAEEDVEETIAPKQKRNSLFNFKKN